MNRLPKLLQDVLAIPETKSWLVYSVRDGAHRPARIELGAQHVIQKLEAFTAAVPAVYEEPLADPPVLITEAKAATGDALSERWGTGYVMHVKVAGKDKIIGDKPIGKASLSHVELTDWWGRVADAQATKDATTLVDESDERDQQIDDTIEVIAALMQRP